MDCEIENREVQSACFELRGGEGDRVEEIGTHSSPAKEHGNVSLHKGPGRA
jgi:hypothetical protein